MLQIKHYGKNYKLLVNGQDFEVFVPRLPTIAEIQDEPLENSIPIPFNAHWTQLMTDRTERIKGPFSTEVSQKDIHFSNSYVNIIK